jgi:hypothetical protein
VKAEPTFGVLWQKTAETSGSPSWHFGSVTSGPEKTVGLLVLTAASETDE